MSIKLNEWSGLALANGRYLIIAKLGEGGMGAVYRAQDRNIDADVVIKVPLRSMLEDSEFSKRFKDEIRSLVKLSHPHIVKVSDVGEWDSLPFAVMQYLPGGSLEDHRPAGPDGCSGASHSSELSRWLTAIANALDYVHSQGYIHRDVKPGNILFDSQGHAFLSDFGVVKVLALSKDAKAARTAMTGTGMVLGTPEYMAPELIMGEPFDGRLDQYALAVTVYEMLCGRRPFEDEVKTKILVQHSTKLPPPLTDFCPSIPARLSQAVLKGLAKDPNERYPTCSALAADVCGAVEAGFAGQVERVRIKCRSCGKSLAVSSLDLAKLNQSGRRVLCPACKAPVEVPSVGQEVIGTKSPGTGTPRGGTVILSPRGNPAEDALADGRRATPPGGTVSLSAKGTPGENPGVSGSDPRRPSVSPKRPTPTVVERHGPSAVGGGSRRTPGATATMKPAAEDQPGPPGERTGNSRSWVIGISLGGAVALSSLVLGISLIPHTRGRGNNSVAAPPLAVQPAMVPTPSPVAIAPAAPSPTVIPSLIASTPHDRPRPGMISVETKPEVVESGREGALGGEEGPSLVSTEGGRLAIPPVPRSDPDAGPLKPADDLKSLAPGAAFVRGEVIESRREPSQAQQEEPAIDLDALGNNLGPVKGNIPLEQILNEPGRFANQVVESSRLYCLGDVATHRPDGSVSLSMIESDLHLQTDGSVQVRRGTTANLSVEPKLAEQLFRLGKVHPTAALSPTTMNWDRKPAILTLWVASRGKQATAASLARIVKFEFLDKFDFAVVSVGYKRKLRIAYNTLTVTSAGETPGKGKPEEWSQVSRLGHIVNQYNRSFENRSRQLSQAQWLQFNNRVNFVIDQGIQNAARNQAADEALRRRMLTPGR